MPRDADSPFQLGFLIKFVEPDLKPEDIETETQYLQEDLLALSGMRQTRFHPLTAHRNQVNFREGVQFQTSPERLRAILRRLCDRLDDNPLETLILIYHGQVRLQIQTHKAEELASIVASAEALLPPESIYLAKAETYVRTRGELSPAEAVNLELLAQQLALTPEEAAELNATAMGPFKSLGEKRQRFLEVMTVEMTHQFPPDQDTKDVLYELAEHLRLPRPEADSLIQNYLQKIQAEAEAKRLKEEAEASRKQAAEQEQYESEKRTQGHHQDQIKQYQELFRQAIQHNLHPLAFDQGRLEQIRQLWQLPKDTVSQIEEEVRSELYGSIQSTSGIHYGRLRQLLWSQSWQEADRETENVILKALSDDMEPLDRDAVMQLNCADLFTIDQLWSRYSNGKFGFQAQYQIFQAAERRPIDFQRLVEWRHNFFNPQGELKPYKSLTFHPNAPKGHLPSWRWCCTSLEGGYDVSDAIIEGFFLHLEKCLSGNINTSPPVPWADSGDISGDI